MLKFLCIAYGIGLAIGLYLLVLASRVDPTRRGRAFLWTYGLAAVIGWPIAMGWSLVLSPLLVAGRLMLGADRR